MPQPQLAAISGHALFHDDRASWLVLSRLPRMGARRWQAVCDHLDTPLELLSIGYTTLRSLGLNSTTCDMISAWQTQDLAHPGLARALAIWQHCQRDDIDLVTWGCADFPEPLRAIHDAPFVLYLKGDRSLLNRPQIGIVGSRNASRGGLDHARQFAVALSEQGYLVTSGLALGVDGAAHEGALTAGYPTIAVIGTGVDVIYPKQHRALTGRITEQGAVVSDLPPGTPPKAAHFPQRNRIISGLSRGVLVVEASPRSGSLITARLALEQGREVFAIPGSIHNPLARGCHQLIRQGAKLVESVADIEEELTAWWTQDRSRHAVIPVAKNVIRSKLPTCAAPAPRDLLNEAAAPAHLDGREIAVLKALGYDPVSTDDLCTATGLPADELMQSLLLLEMEGLVDSAPGGFQRVV